LVAKATKSQGGKVKNPLNEAKKGGKINERKGWGRKLKAGPNELEKMDPVKKGECIGNYIAGVKARRTTARGRKGGKT